MKLNVCNYSRKVRNVFKHFNFLSRFPNFLGVLSKEETSMIASLFKAGSLRTLPHSLVHESIHGLFYNL